MHTHTYTCMHTHTHVHIHIVENGRPIPGWLPVSWGGNQEEKIYNAWLFLPNQSIMTINVCQ